MNKTEDFYVNENPEVRLVQDGFLEKEVKVVSSSRMRITDRGIYIPRPIIAQLGKSLKPIDFFLWVYIYMNEKPGVGLRHSYRKIGVACDLAVNTVRMSIEKMIAIGLIEVLRTERGKLPNRYKTTYNK